MVTLTLPLAPAPTTASIVVAEVTVNEVAGVPPKLTAVAPVKLRPVIVTVVPVPALVGLNDDIAGADTKVKPASVAVPKGVVRLTVPEVPVATTASTEVAELTVNEVAGVPPKSTAVAPSRFVPVMVTVFPAPAEVGVSEVMVGGSPKVKPAIVPVPPGVVTLTAPELPAPNTASMELADSTVNEAAAVPPKLTTVAPVKLVPVMVM